MFDTQKILSLLGTGLSQEVVATAVGCDPSYISQLLEDENFKNKVIELRLVSLTSATTRDSKYDKLEDELLDKLNESIQFLIKPRDVLSALAILNKAERRGAKPQEQTVVNNTIVNLTLPKKVVNKFITNSSQQVVAVNDKSLITLDSNKLSDLLKNKKEAVAQERITSDETKRLTGPSITRSSGFDRINCDSSDEELCSSLGG